MTHTTLSSDSSRTRRLALAGVFTALAIVGSFLSFPVAGSKCAPVQHIINILAAVTLGPWYSVGIAFCASLLRNLLGLGSMMAFPGSMVGALCCGLVYSICHKLSLTCLAEALGTGILGGNIVSMELSGQIAAEMANEIVHGKNPAEYTSIIDSPNIYCIDEAVMRKYGLDLKLIPKDARIINHTPTFIEKYHIILMPIAIIMLLLLIIIVFLLLRSIKQYFLTRELDREKKKIAEDSTYDFLTGLSNRSKLYSDLNILGAGHASCALFIFDIDGFKQINDTYGHQAGDEVLTELGKRISSVKNPAFTPYRLAGDEFICIYRTRNHEQIDECARHCMELFEPDFKIKDLSISVKISLGIAVSPDDCIGVEKLIECADKAMYTVKKNGKNSYAWYSDIKEK